MEKGKWFESSLRLREMRHFCRENMKKLRSPFSYNRLNALNDFVRRLKFMSDTEMTHFVQVQDDPHLNVARQLFPSVISPVPMLVPPSLLEKLRALELLQYLCLVHQASRRYVREINGIEVLLRQLEHQHAPIQTAALDAILSCLHDSKENQEVFHSRSGFFKVVKLLKQKQCPLEVRLKSTEFLYLFVAYFDEQARDSSVSDYTTPSPGENKRMLNDILGIRMFEMFMKTLTWSATEGVMRGQEFLQQLDQML